MARHSGSITPIDPAAARRFFEERGKKILAVGPLNAVLYQDQQPGLAIRRNEAEQARVMQALAPQSGHRVLDVGCGTGRWALALADRLENYLGLDFCQAFLDSAQQATKKLKQPDRFAFQQWDLSNGTLPANTKAAFDLVIVAGVFPYLNDEIVPKTVHALAEATTPNGKIYIREPLATEERLTLDRHYSNDLQAEYSAIYRPEKDFALLLQRELVQYGFAPQEHGDLFPPELNNRPDTRQFFYIFSRTGS